MPQHNDGQHPVHTQHLRDMLAKLVKNDDVTMTPIVASDKEDKEDEGEDKTRACKSRS